MGNLNSHVLLLTESNLRLIKDISKSRSLIHSKSILSKLIIRLAAMHNNCWMLPFATPKNVRQSETTSLVQTTKSNRHQT